MSIIKYIANADTTITNAFKPDTTSRAFYANLGAADSLEVFSIAHSGSYPEKSRILLNFPIDKIIENRISGIVPPSGSVNFILKLYNVQHPETLPKNYNMVIKPLSGSWDEGYGLDLETYSDNGQTQTTGYGVGWKFRSSTQAPFVWSTDGGDFWDGYDTNFYFDKGTEDLEVDITKIVEDQINGTISRDGVAVMLSTEFEDNISGVNFYTKRFSARSSEYFYKLPSLEARWSNYLSDDRGNFFFESNNLSDEENIQNIYFYNKFNGILKDLPNDVIPNVKILDENDQELITNITSSRVATGIYKMSIKMTGSLDATLTDVWYSGSKEYFVGNIDAKIRTLDDSYTASEYILNITNLKHTYSTQDFATFKVFTRNKDWSPNIYKISNSDIETIILNNLYYKVFRVVDNYTIIDYGIDPIQYTKCSYDKNGNYFNLDMSMFESGYDYAIKLMILDGTTRKEYPKIFKFKVE